MTRDRQAVLVVEDVAATRDWLVQLAGVVFSTTEVATAATLAEGLSWVSEQATDSAPICLVDLGLPDGSGTDFIRALMNRCPDARAVVTTLYDDDANLLNAMAAGASGYILKDQEPELLGTKLAAMERGEVPMSPAISRRILSHFQNSARFMTAPQATVTLTRRETDVLRLVGRGLKVAEAAETLQISPQTVSSYLKTIYRKLDINGRAEAALEAARLGLI